MRDDYPIETRTREQLMEALKSNGMVGYDQSPGDPVARWAHKRILELEQTLRWIAGVDVPQDPALRVAVEARLGMRFLARGALNLPDEAPDKNLVITGDKPDDDLARTQCDQSGCDNDASFEILDAGDGELVGYECELHASESAEKGHHVREIRVR